MTQTNLISDDLLNSVPLEHHGIKNMKWGVWNEETRRKYMGGTGRAMSAKMKELARKGKDSVNAFAKRKVDEYKQQRADKKQQRIEQKEQRKELGMTRQQYESLRKTTLRSHDPRVVAKGMRTLTDKELNDKLTRLQTEEKISKMATDLQKRRYEVKDARMKSIKANPLYSVGMNVLGKSVNKALNVAGSAVKNANNSKKNSNSDNSGGNKPKADNSGANESKSSVKLPKRDPSPYSQSGPGSNESVRKAVRESAFYNQSTSSDSARSAATRGERLLSDGTIRATVIDVQPVSASSEREQLRKLRMLPAAS